MKRNERKLAKLILCALLAGGTAWTPSAASAANYAIDSDTTVIDTRGGEHSNDNYKFVADGILLTVGNDGFYGSDTLVNVVDVNGRRDCAIRAGNPAYTTFLSVKQVVFRTVGGQFAFRYNSDKNKSIFGAVCAYDHDPSNPVHVTGRQAAVSGGDYDAVIGGAVISRFANGSVTKNTVTISGGTVAEAYGGYSGYSSTGAVSENTVAISGGTVTDVYGGYSELGAANGNKVEISGGAVNGGVYGGMGSTEASGNTVEISGGTVNGVIFGGMSGAEASGNTVTVSGGTLSREAYIYGGGGAPTANNNTVNILTRISVKGLYGGVGMTTSSGNTLNLAAKGVKVGGGGMNSFQNLNFFLPKDMTAADIMLKVNGTADVTNAKVGILARGKLTNLKEGDRVTLLNAAVLTGGATVERNKRFRIPAGIAHTYEMTLTGDANNIYADLTKVDGGSDEGGGGGNSTDNTKSVVETKAAAITFVGAGADMLASQGFAQAANAVALETLESAKNGADGGTGGNGFTPFAAFGGTSLRAESGSHVDTKGFGINVGFAREIANSQGKLLFGPVVEYGGGSYDSYLDNGVHGEGGAHYLGVGLMARQVNHNGFYYEGSLRGGRVKSDYKGTFNLQTVNYDTSANYWAAHLGIGKVFAAGKRDTVDGYLKYFYAHQSGDSVTLHTTAGDDENWIFDSVDSNRLRIGARLTHKVNDRNSFYGGLAYQYEFSGEARAHYEDGATPSPSVKGSSGLLELGWQVKPGNGPLTLDLGVTGWAGKQLGGSVQLGATWSF